MPNYGTYQTDVYYEYGVTNEKNINFPQKIDLSF